MPDFETELAEIDAELLVLEDSYKMIEALALADGIIDPDEREALDDLNGKIKSAKSERSALIKAEASEEEARDAEAARVQTKTERAETWDPVIEGVQTAAEEKAAAAQGEALSDFVDGMSFGDEGGGPEAPEEDEPRAAVAHDPPPPTQEPGATGIDPDYPVEDLPSLEDALAREAEADEAFDKDATLGQELLELHRDLYQEFLNAGDPLNPDLITAGQETILEEMRIINEELAIEAERSVLAHDFERTKGLEGEDLIDEHQRAEFDEDGSFNEDLNYETPDDESDDGAVSDPYKELLESGVDNEDATIDELLHDGLSEENRLMMHGELDDEMVKERIEQVRKVRGLAPHVNIGVNRDGDRIVGFHYDGEQDDGKDYGKINVDLNGNFVAREWDTTSIPGEVVMFGVEIAASILVPPMEYLYDARDLYDATLEYSQAEDGSLVPLIVTGSAVVVPRLIGSKRFFKIGKKLIEAGRISALIKKGVTGEALEGIGITAGKKTDTLLDNVVEESGIADAGDDLLQEIANSPGMSDEAIQEAIEAANRGMGKEIAGQADEAVDVYRQFLDNEEVKDIFAKIEEAGFTKLDDIGVTQKDLRRWVGEGTDEELAWAKKQLRYSLQDKLDDRALDEMIDPTPLPDDWHEVPTTPDISAAYKDGIDIGDLNPDALPDEWIDIIGDVDPDTLTDAEKALKAEIWDKKYREMLVEKGVDVGKMTDDAISAASRKLDKDYYDALDTANKKLGFKGTPAEVKAGLKKLKKLMSSGMEKEFAEIWAKKASASDAAQEKMDWVRKCVIRLEELEKKLEGLKKGSSAAKTCKEEIEEVTKQRNEIARSAFNNVRDAFWRDLNKNHAKLLEEAGLKVESGSKAPALEAIGQGATVEHKNRLQDAPLRAIDSKNMTFSFNYENTVLLEQHRRLYEQRMRELGHEDAIPWL